MQWPGRLPIRADVTQKNVTRREQEHGNSHIAFAARDTHATQRFYTEAMGFELVKVEVARIGGGWDKHLF